MLKFLCTSQHVNYLGNISEVIRYTGQCYLLYLAFLFCGCLVFFNAGSIKLLSLLSLEIVVVKFCLVLDPNVCFQSRVEDGMIEVKQNVIWNVFAVILPE